MSFYIAIITFILSIIAGLIALIVSNKLSKEKFYLFTTLHGILLICFLASLILKKDPDSTNYFFLIYICSGILLSGLAWKANAILPLRIYFSLFLLTVGLFMISPSTLVNFLLTASFKDNSGEQFLVQENYFIERQNTSMKNDGQLHYKLIQKKGIFHATIQLDLVFNGKLDSIKVLDFDKSSKGLIRGYTSIKTFVSTQIDSLDVEITLTKKSADGVEYKL